MLTASALILPFLIVALVAAISKADERRNRRRWDAQACSTEATRRLAERETLARARQQCRGGIDRWRIRFASEGIPTTRRVSASNSLEIAAERYGGPAELMLLVHRPCGRLHAPAEDGYIQYRYKAPAEPHLREAPVPQKVMHRPRLRCNCGGVLLDEDLSPWRREATREWRAYHSPEGARRRQAAAEDKARQDSAMAAELAAHADERDRWLRSKDRARQVRDELKSDGRLRWRIFAADAYHCRECGVGGGAEELTIDHVIPVSRGGTNSPSNLQTLCRSCNSRKGARL